MLTKKDVRNISALAAVIIALLAVLFPSQLTQPSESQQHTQITSSPLPTSAPQATSSGEPAVLSAQTATPAGGLYAVTKVVDGDTIKVALDDRIETVRLMGINTPETVDPRRSVECMGKEASAFARQLMDGALVRLEKDPTQGDRDRYGRLLRFVFLPDGMDVGKALLLAGFAQESLYSSKPHRYRTEYLSAQATAQVGQKGLWNPSACTIAVPE